MHISSSDTTREQHDRSAIRTSLHPAPSVLFFVGLLVFVVGERGFQVTAARWPMVLVAGVLVLISFGLQAKHAFGGNVEVHGVHRVFLVLFAPLVLGIGAYIASQQEDAEHKGLLLVTAILLILTSTMLQAVVAWAVRPMEMSGWVEPRRLKVALAAGTSFTLALLGFGLLNFVVKKNDWRYESSNSGPTMPSSTTRTLWESSENSVEIFLFFAKGNPLLKDVEDYFHSLQPDLALTILDPAMDPKLAKEMKVSRQGTVALRHETRSEKTYIGATVKDQKRGLAKLDKEVRTGLARLTREEVAVHFSVGHGERRGSAASKKERPGVSNFRKRIKEYNTKPKNLGLQEGLGTDIPDDTRVVMVLGPKTPFLQEEVESLKRYVDTGGALLLTLDPTSDHGLDELLEYLGVQLSKADLASDKVFLRQSHTRADHALLPSNRFSSHKVTNPLKKREDGMVIFAGVGGLNKMPKDKLRKKSRISFVARSHESTFVDVERNFVFDKDKEKRGVQNLIATIVHASPTDAASSDTSTKTTEARVVVIGDSEVFSDGLWPVMGNQVLATQTLLWLLGDDRVEGEVVVTDDVEIKHTRDEDVLWFYFTVFGAPLLALLMGAFMVRTRRRMRGAQ
ncbi:MAG: hypothetical protein GY822_22200 [Deltaproteobacteria bacterium]|nr:hypothetical protein [Deltaproteobacteria bacterium]